jgi:alpha-galactosidase
MPIHAIVQPRARHFRHTLTHTTYEKPMRVTNSTRITLSRSIIAIVLTIAVLTQLSAAEILTPKPPATPRINGARVFGVRPGSPVLFTVPATGDEPIVYSAENLPDGLAIDSTSGRITGKLETAGEYKIALIATNEKGKDRKPLTIKVGEDICLTPPMGWNSWNCWGVSVDEAKVRAAAEAMVKFGLVKHGWTYINIDDAWQGKRGGEFNGIQPNEKFPDMKKLADDVHGMGLKLGVYSTPWKTSYAGYVGGSSDNEDGAWDNSIKRGTDGKISFADNDAKQWAAWGIDYLKYDWNPRSAPRVSDEVFKQQTETMQKALLKSGRDLVYSYSNSMPFDQIGTQSKMLNAWRTSGDIRDNWQSMSSKGFGEEKWAKFAMPGHWNDPDMLVVGMVGWGPKLHASKLTPDEQYTHISVWALVASPLLIGCDLTQLDEFTLGLLTNDEVIAVNQDELGKQATQIAEDLETGTCVLARPLADGTYAVGLFNRGTHEIVNPPRPKPGEEAARVWKVVNRATKQATEFKSQAEAEAELAKLAKAATVSVKWSDLKVDGSQQARDLWRGRDLGSSDSVFTTPELPSHGCMLIKIGTPREAK